MVTREQYRIRRGCTPRLLIIFCVVEKPAERTELMQRSAI